MSRTPHKVGEPVRCQRPSETVYHWERDRPIRREAGPTEASYPWRVLNLDEDADSAVMRKYHSLAMTGICQVKINLKTLSHAGEWWPNECQRAVGYRQIQVSSKHASEVITLLFSERNKQRAAVLGGHGVLGSEINDPEHDRQMARFDEAMAKHKKG